MKKSGKGMARNAAAGTPEAIANEEKRERDGIKRGGRHAGSHRK